MVTDTLLTVLPVSASFFALCYLRVQIIDTPDLSEPRSLKQLSLFICKQTGKNQEKKNTFYEHACVYLCLFVCSFVRSSFLLCKWFCALCAWFHSGTVHCLSLPAIVFYVSFIKLSSLLMCDAMSIGITLWHYQISNFHFFPFLRFLEIH